MNGLLRSGLYIAAVAAAMAPLAVQARSELAEDPAAQVPDRRTPPPPPLAMAITAIRANRIEMPGFDEVRLRDRQDKAGALSWRTGTLAPSKDRPDVQPHDTSLEFIERPAHATDDLDSIDACQP